MTTDTPLDACTHCGATDDCMCFSEELKQALAASKAEVEMLKANLRTAVEIAELPYCRYLHDAATYHELTKLKATLNPTDK